MAKFYTELNQTLREFIDQQKIFFVATAPHEGRVNLSPKGMDTLRCLNDQEVSYLDLTGSGNETAAHITQNGRLTMMFCSFSEKPLILRLYGQGILIRPRDPRWEEFHSQFESYSGERQIILLKIEAVQTSCGFAIPFYEYQGERPTLTEWAERKGESGLQDYWQTKNQISIDGLSTGLLSE